MIEKIIANGRPGAAAAALEVAIKLGVTHGGWCREGEPLPDKYQIVRLPDDSDRSITERAVQAGQGTLYFINGETTSLSLETTKKTALRLNKPMLIEDLERENGFAVSRRIAVWIAENRIRVLHVDGAGESHLSASTADRVSKILESTFFLSMVESGAGVPLQSVVAQGRLSNQKNPPETMQAALDHLEASLSLKDRAIIANMTPDELVSLHFTLGSYINSHFDLFTTNTNLLTACQRWAGQSGLAPKDVAAVIIRALWDRLRRTCRIRIVK